MSAATAKGAVAGTVGDSAVGDDGAVESTEAAERTRVGIDLRLAIPAAVAWAAALAAITVPEFALPATVGAWAAAAVALLLRRPGVALALGAVALVCTSVAMQAPARQPADLLAAAERGTQLTVVASLNGTVQPGDRSFEADLLRDGADVPVLVFGQGPDARLGLGTRVELQGRLQTTPAGDDRAFVLFPTGPPRVLDGPPPALAWADGLRLAFLDAAAPLPGDGGDLLPGLAIGDTGAVSTSLDAAMKTSSLSHLTAVSGANCAIVIGLVLALGRLLGLGRRLRAVLALASLIGFVLLVTPEPSVLRAAVMAGLVLFAMVGGRPARGVPMLALAVLALLTMDPWLAVNYGFALSALATLGLLVLAGPLASRLERVLPRWLAVVIAVPVAAQLAVQPVLILLDASLPTYGIVANLLAAPAAPIATVLGLAACLLATPFPALATGIAWLAWLPATWIAGIATFFAEAPAARLPWPGGILGAAALAVATGIAVVALLRARRWAVMAVIALVVVYAGLAGGSRVAQVAGRPADWAIAACDVGQGDAFLLRSGAQVALIDTGPDPALLRTCLTELGIRRIDLLVLSHYDLDHVGGLDAVVGNVDAVLAGPTGSPGDESRLAALRSGGARVQQVSAGPSGTLGDSRWTVLWPPARLGDLEPGNQTSVVLRVEPLTAGGMSALFLGDLGEGAQQRLPALQPVDVVKVSHHGSADQSAETYSRSGATVGMIGVGAGNGYGHPRPSLMNTLTAAGTTAVRTDKDGMVLLAPGGEPGAVRVWTQR